MAKTKLSELVNDAQFLNATQVNAIVSKATKTDELAQLAPLPVSSTIPAGVAVPGNAFALTATGGALTNAPIISEWHKTAGPNEHIMFTGYGLKNLDWKVYGNGLLLDAASNGTDTEKGALLLPVGLSKWDMYVAWPRNDSGYGRPITINKTELHWSDKTVSGGMTVSVYGRNLARNNQRGTNNSSIYLKPVSGTGAFMSVTNVNPYRVQFSLPPNMTPGSYQVWCHNGHGGAYGWSEPLTITIVAAQDHVLTRTWGNTFNIMDYGAVPNNPSVDNSTAINQATNAAAAVKGVIFIPSGEFTVKNYLIVKEYVKYLGEVDANGKSASIIKIKPDFIAADFGLWGMFMLQSMIMWENVTLDNSANVATQKNTQLGTTAVFIQLSGADMLHFKNCPIIAGNQIPIAFNTKNNSNIFLDKCAITGRELFVDKGKQIKFSRNTFNLSYDCDAAIISWSSEDVSFTENTIKDKDNTTVDGWGVGRIFQGQGQSGITRNGYYADNFGKSLGVRLTGANIPDANRGEQYLWEGNTSHFHAYPTSAMANTVTFSNGPTVNDVPAGNAILMIVKGKGIGQRRVVTANSGTGLISVDKDFLVIPDASSQIQIGSFAINQVVYRNSNDSKGKPNLIANYNAGTGTSLYGGMGDCVVDSNTFDGSRSGVTDYPTSHGGGLDANHFNMIIANRLLNNRDGIVKNYYSQTGSLSAIASLCTLHRMNRIEGAETDINVNLPRDTAFVDPVFDGQLYEHNILREQIQNHRDDVFNQPVIPVFPGTMGLPIFYENM